MLKFCDFVALRTRYGSAGKRVFRLPETGRTERFDPLNRFRKMVRCNDMKWGNKP